MYYSVRIVTTVVVFAVLVRYVSNAAAQLIQKPTEALLIFAILPFTYYFFDYATGVYTELIYSGKKVVSEFLGFALSIAYLLFLLVYFKQYNVIEENRIDFKTSICIPEQLPVSDVDLTSILSNALENAINAVLPLETENRHITLHLRTDDGKLLISLKNTFAVQPTFTDGIPNSCEEGHGFGTQSIRYVTEKLNGNCQFSVKDGWFILRVIL